MYYTTKKILDPIRFEIDSGGSSQKASNPVIVSQPVRYDLKAFRKTVLRFENQDWEELTKR